MPTSLTYLTDPNATVIDEENNEELKALRNAGLLYGGQLIPKGMPEPPITAPQPYDSALTAQAMAHQPHGWNEKPTQYLDDDVQMMPSVPSTPYAPIAPGDEGTYSGDPTGPVVPDTAPAAPSAPSAPSLPMPKGVTPQPYTPERSPWTKSLDALEAKMAQRPEKTPPKWWQNVISAGLGGMAGWSNAASRTRNPIDIAAQTENILHPGYAHQLSQWQSGVDKLKGVADIEGQKQAGDWKTQEIMAESRLKSAQVEEALALAGYHRGQSRSVPVTKALEELTGGIFHVGGPDIPASVAENMAKVGAEIEAGRWDKKHPEMMRAINPEAAKLLDVPVNTNVPFDRYKWAMGIVEKKPDAKAEPSVQEGWAMRSVGINPDRRDLWPPLDDPRWAKLHEKLKPPSPYAGLGAALAAQRFAEAETKHTEDVDSKKNRVEKEIIDKRNAQLAAPGFLTQEDKDRINLEASNALQANSDEYARAIRARKGTATDFKITPRKDNGFDWKQRGVPPPVLTGPPTSAAGGPATVKSPSSPAAQPMATAPAAKPAAAQGTPAPAAPAEQPFHVNLPGGKRKVFPNKKAAEDFARAAGLTMQ